MAEAFEFLDEWTPIRLVRGAFSSLLVREGAPDLLFRTSLQGDRGRLASCGQFGKNRGDLGGCRLSANVLRRAQHSANEGTFRIDAITSIRMPAAEDPRPHSK